MRLSITPKIKLQASNLDIIALWRYSYYIKNYNNICLQHRVKKTFISLLYSLRCAYSDNIFNHIR